MCLHACARTSACACAPVRAILCLSLAHGQAALSPKFGYCFDGLILANMVLLSLQSADAYKEDDALHRSIGPIGMLFALGTSSLSPRVYKAAARALSQGAWSPRDSCAWLTRAPVAAGMAAEQAALVVCHGAGMLQSPMLACDCGVVLVGLAEALIYSQASAILVLRTPRLILGLSVCAVCREAL